MMLLSVKRVSTALHCREASCGRAPTQLWVGMVVLLISEWLWASWLRSILRCACVSERRRAIAVLLRAIAVAAVFCYRRRHYHCWQVAAAD